MENILKLICLFNFLIFNFLLKCLFKIINDKTEYIDKIGTVYSA